MLDTASDNVIACSTNSQTLGIIVIEEIGYEERPNVKDWKDISNKQKIRRIQEAELLITELAAESNVSAFEKCSFILKRLTGPRPPPHESEKVEKQVVLPTVSAMAMVCESGLTT